MTLRNFKFLSLLILVYAAFACLPVKAQESDDTTQQLEVLKLRQKALLVQKDIDDAKAKLNALAKAHAARSAPKTTDEEMASTNEEMKLLELKQHIAELEQKKQDILHPPATAAPTPGIQQQTKPASAAVSAEDQEMQRLNEEHQRLLKQQEIARLKAENDKLGRPPQPAQPSATLPAPKPECVAVPKKKGLLGHLQDITDRQLDKAGKVIDKKTGGNGQQSSLPTTSDLADSSDGTCPAGTAPKQ